MITPLTPIDFKRRASKLYPKKTAIIDGDSSWTYEEFDRRTWRLSHGLQSLGLTFGDHIAVMLPNTHEMIECFYGIGQMGAVMVPLNVRLAEEEVLYILDHSDAKAIIVDSEFGSMIECLIPRLTQIHTFIQVESGFSSTLNARDYETLLESASGSPFVVDLDENQAITINYTSGTTSKPKGVILTHRNNYINAADFLYHLRVVHEDVYLHTLPLFHANGWGGVWALTAVGATHICMRKVDPVQTLKLMVDQQVTLACGAPTVLNMLINAPGADQVTITTHPRMATAGSPPPAAVIDKVQKMFHMDIIHVYGLTEVSPFITYCEWRAEFNSLPQEEKAKIKARQGVELVFNGETKVVRKDASEVEWNGREIGEIVTRGNVVMEGYYKQPDQTAKAIRDGWFYTGDLAVVYSDGYIEIVDRSKDVIISGGENVSSVEVEGVLYEHPSILEVGVIAIPDEQWGEVPKAYIVLKDGMTLDETELREWCRSRMGHFKVPKIFAFVDMLPRTATGKLQKYRLREQDWRGSDKFVN